MRALLAALPLMVTIPAEFGLNLQVIEDGHTYAENAARKAFAFHRAIKQVLNQDNLPDDDLVIVLADDSGLEVSALNGAPGLHSARYSQKPGADDADRRSYLLEQLRTHPRPWHARFCCTVAIVDPSGDLHTAEGKCPGEIINQERGSSGFGYDPIFLIPHLGRTMAELTMAEKNQLSHRAQAVSAARPILENLISNRGN